MPVAGVSSRWTFGTKDSLDLVETAHLTFKGAADGEIAFGALKGFLDVRYGTRDGSACAEFSWEGNENDPTSGRGWVVLGTAGRLVGHFYIHNGEDSASYAIVPDFFNGLLVLTSARCHPVSGRSIILGCAANLLQPPPLRGGFFVAPLVCLVRLSALLYVRGTKPPALRDVLSPRL